MYKIADDFLPRGIFLELQEYCSNNQFQIVTVGDKQFSVLNVPDSIKKYIDKEGYKTILSFIRSAYSDFDNDWRIHADNIIMGERVSLASVLYINDLKGISENGTAMWDHHLHGKELSECVSEKEYNRLILEDANDLSKWTKTDYIKSKPNRLLTYNANLFHSKYPNRIEKGNRIVLASFYKKL